MKLTRRPSLTLGSLASSLGAQLMRHPLGAVKRQVFLVGVCLSLSGCLAAPRPQLVVQSGSLDTLRGVSEVAVYAAEPELGQIKAELAQLNPAIVFTTADNAQLIIHFTQDFHWEMCIDCGEEWTPGLIRYREANASVQRHDDRDHCLPSLLMATWAHEAYSRKTLVRAFVQSLAPYLKGAGA